MNVDEHKATKILKNTALCQLYCSDGTGKKPDVHNRLCSYYKEESFCNVCQEETTLRKVEIGLMCTKCKTVDSPIPLTG